MPLVESALTFGPQKISVMHSASPVFYHYGRLKWPSKLTNQPPSGAYPPPTQKAPGSVIAYKLCTPVMRQRRRKERCAFLFANTPSTTRGGPHGLAQTFKPLWA